MGKYKYILIISLLFLIISVSCTKTYAAIIFNKLGSPYHLTEDYIITNHDTIIIEKGTIIVMSQNVNMITNGVIIINGIKEDPVIFKPEVQGIGWGLIEINCPGKTSHLNHAFFIDGTILSWYCDISMDGVTFQNNHALGTMPILFVRVASVNIINSFVYSNNTGEGFQLLNSESVLIKNCYFSQAPDAIELTNIIGGNISHNWIEYNYDDGIDLNNCSNTLIDSNYIINSTDRGIEIGSENNGSSENILVKRNVIIGCNVGIIFKENSYGQVINNTFYKNINGVRCIEDNGTKDGSFAKIENCIFSQSTMADVSFDNNSTTIVNYCLSDQLVLNGENNQIGDPLFVNPNDWIFLLQENSPCINTGNPQLPKDPDNSISDIGAFFYNTDTTFIGEFQELVESIRLFPNPFKDVFSILLNNPPNIKISIRLATLAGESIPFEILNNHNSNEILIKVKPRSIIESYQVIICNISIGKDSRSWKLVQK
jgi:hypothetical protein